MSASSGRGNYKPEPQPDETTPHPTNAARFQLDSRASDLAISSFVTIPVGGTVGWLSGKFLGDTMRTETIVGMLAILITIGFNIFIGVYTEDVPFGARLGMITLIIAGALSGIEAGSVVSALAFLFSGLAWAMTTGISEMRAPQ